jgi:hypothetical protein
MISEADARELPLSIRGAKLCRSLSLMPTSMAPNAPTYLLTAAFDAVRAHVPHLLLQRSGKPAATNTVAVASASTGDPTAGAPERAAKRSRNQAAKARVD